ncbi:unnamed protein product [Fusarium fujikuroi]|nr:unnamed protein product [Fusarium fujikuroi]
MAEREYAYLSLHGHYVQFLKLFEALFYRCLHYAGVENPRSFAAAEDVAYLMNEFKELKLRDGAAECIQKLRDAGFTVWCFTTGDISRVGGYFSKAGVDMPAENLLSCDTNGVAKPCPEAYGPILNKLSTSESKPWFAAAHLWDVSGAKSAGASFFCVSIAIMTPPNPPRKILMAVTVGGYTHAGNIPVTDFDLLSLTLYLQPQSSNLYKQLFRFLLILILRSQSRMRVFLEKHKKTPYLALGTHIILSKGHAAKPVQGLVAAMDQGLIDGVIWSIFEAARRDIDTSHQFSGTGGECFAFASLLKGEHSYFLITTFAPQRAILDHDHTAIYLTHGGGSSANEGLYHGKRMLAIGFFFDQISNRIAKAALRRKELGADLIEEVMYGTEGRFDGEKELRPMHLQTSDMRMSTFKPRNWDLWLVGLVTLGVVPLASITVGKWAWTEKRTVGHWVVGNCEELDRLIAIVYRADCNV